MAVGLQKNSAHGRMHGFELPKFGYTTQTPAEATMKCLTTGDQRKGSCNMTIVRSSVGCLC